MKAADDQLLHITALKSSCDDDFKEMIVTMGTLNRVALGQNLNSVLLALIPMIALMGNAPADIALVLVILAFFGTHWMQVKEFIGSRFLQLSVLFWAWLLFCSVVSKFPDHSFQDSLPWIRFPLYAFALSQILAADKGRAMRVFIAAAMLGTLIEIGFLLHEYSTNPAEIARLRGTFSKLMPGWYLVCFGLVSVLVALQSLRIKLTWPFHRVATVVFFLVTTVGVIITGEVMNTAAYLGTVLIFLVLRPFEGRRSLFLIFGGALLVILALVTVVWVDAALYQRLMVSAMKRLPWMASSDYNLPWTTGVTMAIENPFFGVGPKNFNLYCLSLKDAGTLEAILHVTECQWHPHNLYLQILSEAGVTGLILFVLLAGYICKLAYRHSLATLWADNIPLILAFTLFFPIQTYSQAFGQSKNFFMWTVIGFVLGKIRAELVSTSSSTDQPIAL
jgi:O-antigen ligase